jgi:hypothetical protein
MAELGGIDHSQEIYLNKNKSPTNVVNVKRTTNCERREKANLYVCYYFEKYREAAQITCLNLSQVNSAYELI